MEPAVPLTPMGLRISARQSGEVTVVRIDGQLHKSGVAELEMACRAIAGPLCLDLANLQSIDAEGARAISTLEAQGAAVAGITPYIATLLKRAGRV